MLTENLYLELMTVTCSVPQGSILCPLLFIFYMNNIVKTTNIFNFILSADDTNMFHSHTHFTRLVKEVNSELDKISAWFHSTNKLSLYMFLKIKNTINTML